MAAAGARTVLVAGAAGALGLRIARRLTAGGTRVVATYRTERPEAIAALAAAGCETAALDLADTTRAAELIAGADAAILTPILTASGPAARAALAKGAQGRLVLFSSNNVAIDAGSAVYRALRSEEDAVRAAGGDAVVVRPTMIYGHANDGNLSRLLRLAKAWPALPLPGTGRALQQPIHVDDLAALAVALLDAPRSAESLVTAAGPEPLSLKSLYQAVARAAGREPPRVVTLPRAPVAAMAQLAKALSLAFPYDPAQLARIELDKTPVGPGLPGWMAQIGVQDGLDRLAAELASGPSA